MSNVICTDVPDDLKQRVEAEQESGESRSAVMRRLIRRGLRNDRNRAVDAFGLVGAVLVGIAVEPIASPEILIAAAAGFFTLSGLIEKGYLDR